jgi:hypothetical protein
MPQRASACLSATIRTARLRGDLYKPATEAHDHRAKHPQNACAKEAARA